MLSPRTSSIDLQCPACLCTGVGLSLVVENQYRLVKCLTCSTQYFRPDHELSRASTETISEYWEDYKFELYSNESVQAEFEVRYDEFIRCAFDVATCSSVLDIGCGIGNFVAFAQSRGLRAYGVDLEPRAVDTARSRGLSVDLASRTHTLIESEGQVDLMTMWDVIEHLYEPDRTLVEASASLKPGGVFLLETPDASFPLRNAIRGVHRASRGRLDVTEPMYYWEHKIYFTETGLRLILARNGFDTVTVIRRTSPRQKMQQIFDHKAEHRGIGYERLLTRVWPVLQRLTQIANTGNKLIVVAQKRNEKVGAGLEH